MALDCSALDNSFPSNVCMVPEAAEAWQKMEQALEDARAGAPDQATRDTIQASQDRWLGMMGGWDVDATRAALVDPSDAGIVDQTNAAGTVDAQLAEAVQYRARRISHLLENMASAKADLVRLAALNPPGLVLASDTGCFFNEPEAMPSGHWDTFCGGTLSLQRGGRVCSAMTYWFSGHVNTVFSVDDLVDGKITHRGHCDWDGVDLNCPDGGSGEASPWDLQVTEDVEAIHSTILNSAAAPPSPLAPIDPESWSDLYFSDWFDTCLTKTEYPPKG